MKSAVEGVYYKHWLATANDRIAGGTPVNKRTWDLYAPIYERAMRADQKIYDFMYERIPTVIRDKDVLEIATGPGLLAKHVAPAARTMLATDYSDGERQRISIARALLKNAPIVLLDEATASLDVENETKVQGALSRLLAGKTVLVIAHRMRTVEAADKIVVLTEGKVAEEGSPAELLAKENGVFRRMAQLQSASAGWSI